ncbi:pilus assembly protein TadG-related protein [Nocardioides yefusunii]|uniref:Pilus assembly protein TadG-related protein n=1 Tax=Nocardioides yefusunii TaxID=2500546 RepID=A0ABW1QXJ3_9ACTN|nr:pilus assembly protein TadG-related protein [Nocardioides yefusunii]
MRRRRDESGQVSVLIIGFAAVLLLALALVVDASTAFLHRQGLDSIADGAALHAADAGVSASLSVDATDDRLAIDAFRASAAATDYLRSVEAGRRYPGLRHEVEVTPAGAVLVRLSAPVELPLLIPGMSRTATVRASARAAVTVIR